MEAREEEDPGSEIGGYLETSEGDSKGLTAADRFGGDDQPSVEGTSEPSTSAPKHPTNKQSKDVYIRSFMFTRYDRYNICSVLGKTHLGAKCDFEIWAFKVFSLDMKNTP